MMSRKKESRGQKSEISGQKLEVRGQEQVRSENLKLRMVVGEGLTVPEP